MAIRNAAQAVSDARRNQAQVAEDSQRVADAERDAADVARDVAESIAEAKRNQARWRSRVPTESPTSRRVENALEDERDAQEALSRAREDAAWQLEDLQERVSDYALDQEGAAIRVAEAEEELRR
ncbi:hypothetical protein HBB16_04445 [Pseudonocardia sp. MCCB 268]|nr:hypothetical protein [Pseudonocardia cytotoxica]